MFWAIKISKSDPTPLYIQLANELIRLIDSGMLPAKTKLPTIRTLSSKLKINRDTVVNAYRLLESKNYVIAHIGSGTYVAPQIAPAPLESKLSPIACSRAVFPRELFSINICQNLLSKVLEDEGWEAFSDPLQRERQLIRQSISNYLKSVGVCASPTKTRLIKDSSQLILELLKLSPKSTICVEAYRDLNYTTTLRNLGFKIIEVPMTPDGMDLNILEHHLKSSNVAYILATPYIQNPTGVCYSEEKKATLIDLCTNYDCYLIEDGTFSDFAYNTTKLTPCYHIKDNDRVIYLYHFCKIYLPHLDYTFAVLPTDLQKRLVDNLQCTLNERLLHYYLQSQDFEDIRQNIILSTQQKYLVLHNFFIENKDAFEIYAHDGGLFFWIKPLHLSTKKITQLFLAHNIIVSPADLFTTQLGVNYFRLSIASLSEEQINILIDVLIQTKKVSL
ncbi:MAG: hypothetical protein ATN36_01010 [Epulopiscium sp. Nele67-Bin005]|nr:MAG: hypothetical protein ATN36_01010 [Epulopiscium sp. Nele67-Bin005]